MRILQVSTADVGGGAEDVAKRLFEEYRDRGHDSCLAVGRASIGGDGIFELPNKALRNPLARVAEAAAESLRTQTRFGQRVRGRAAPLARLGEPLRLLNYERGREDFDFPATSRLSELAGQPDVIHCHNLHGAWLPGGGYFDLRELPTLSARQPLVLTLHDAWLLSGHCAHSFDCQRWQTGCGHCPDLTIEPATPRDATAFNWAVKRELYRRSRLFVASPSRWLMQKVEASIIAEGMAQARVIPNGVDLSVFQPAAEPVAAVRERLGLPLEGPILLFAAHGIRQNAWKDFATLRAALALLAHRAVGPEVTLVALGDGGPHEQIRHVQIRFVGWTGDRVEVASYYQAADVYVHAARVDTFPLTVLEALACGTPVVATAVGGIPEQLKSPAPAFPSGAERVSENSATGLLVPPGDPDALARALETILENRDFRTRLAANALSDARTRFDFRRQADAYLEWYEELVESTVVPSTSR